MRNSLGLKKSALQHVLASTSKPEDSQGPKNLKLLTDFGKHIPIGGMMRLQLVLELIDIIQAEPFLPYASDHIKDVKRPAPY